MEMDDYYKSMMAMAAASQVASMIAKNEGMDNQTAMNAFYQSMTYQMMMQDQSMWYASPMAIYFMWQQEKNSDK